MQIKKRADKTRKSLLSFRAIRVFVMVKDVIQLRRAHLNS